MSLNPQSAYCVIATILLLALATACQKVGAAEYVSWLAVRYSDQAVKTFLQGPYKSKAWCDELNQTTWDNVLTACGTCSAEAKFCIPMDELREGWAKALRKERAVYPYVIASPKGRIIISGVTTSVAVAECKRLADSFRSFGYHDSRCVLP